MVKCFNGVMIDCSRVIERHEYYFKLIDFMAEWKLDTLFLHFTDDHGCTVELPGFPRLAAKNAFSLDEIKKLIRYAAKKKIEIIPELETFGHTRYLTDKSKYSYLYAGKRTKILKFNAIDPLSYDTLSIMTQLIKSISGLFPGKYLHIGCDEVNLKDYCLMKGGLSEEKVWSHYVNKIIQITREAGKIPIMWADHPIKNPKIAELLRKDVIAVHWGYDAEDVKDGHFKMLKKAGFKEICAAPSTACYGYRFLPSTTAIDNMDDMAKYVAKYKLKGMLNTIWCPYRYVQGAIYYGVAYGAYTFREKGKAKLAVFNKLFSEKVFGTTEDKIINEFLKHYSEFNIDHILTGDLLDIKWEKEKMTDGHRERMTVINKIGRELLPKIECAAPKNNKDIWEAMVLAWKCAWLFSEHFLIVNNKIRNKERLKEYRKMLKTVTAQVSADWDKTRFPDDPQKYGGKFGGEKINYMMLILHEMKK